MKVGLFLDDERNPEDVFWVKYPKDVEWFVVRRMSDFIFSICNGEIDIISFDHDIQDYDMLGNEQTGYDCLKSLIDYCIDTNTRIPECFFHTQNSVGLENMRTYYNNFLSVRGE